MNSVVVQRTTALADVYRIERFLSEVRTSALDYAHRRGVIHRDIQRENRLRHDGSAEEQAARGEDTVSVAGAPAIGPYFRRDGKLRS